MVGRGEEQLGAKSTPQTLPKMAKELGVPITNNGARYPMQFQDMINKSGSYMLGIISLFARNEVSHFGESVNDNKNAIVSSSSPG